MHFPRLDFSIELVQCRWQVFPPREDALGLARGWLQAASIDGTGLHRDPRGRPRLPDGTGDIGWSHSAGRLLTAYIPQGLIGVDIEPIGRAVNAMAIARRHFARDEVEALSALDDAGRQHAFLRLWCAKEAVLKAAGLGIAFGLHRVAFDVCGAAPRMIQCDRAFGDVDGWTIHQVEPEPGFIAVLATTP